MRTLHVPVDEHAVGFVTVAVPDASTEEQIFEAAQAAYDDGGAFINHSEVSFHPDRAEAA